MHAVAKIKLKVLVFQWRDIRTRAFPNPSMIDRDMQYSENRKTHGNKRCPFPSVNMASSGRDYLPSLQCVHSFTIAKSPWSNEGREEPRPDH